MKPRVSIFILPPHWVKLPNLSGVYLKSYLRSKGIKDVTVYDFNIECFGKLKIPARRYLALNKDFEEGFFQRIREDVPGVFKRILTISARSDIIGFSLFSRNRVFSFKLYEQLRERFPRKAFVFGGPEAMKMYVAQEPLPEPEGDTVFWVAGEGEKPLYDVCSGKEQERKFLYQEIDDLDTLPFLDFDDYDFSLYRKKMIPLISSRGCPYQCNFCSESFLYKKFRHHSPGYMVEHIQHLLAKYHISTFSFQDSLFNYNLSWLEEFCSLLIKKNCTIQWEAQMRVRKDFSPALAQLVKRSGCFGIFVGLESGSDKVLQAMNKGFTTEDALRFFKVLNAAHLYFEMSMILGYPDETEGDYDQTVDFVLKNRKHIPKVAQVNPFVLYTPSRIAEKCTADVYHANGIGNKRVKAFCRVLKRNKIRHTEAFVNNLLYTDDH